VRAAAAALASALLVFATAHAASPVADDEDASKPFIVKIHADWCGTCTRMNPTFDALMKRDDARIVVLDVTDREKVEAALAEAERLGIRDFFMEYRGKTGTVGVLRGDNREVVEVLRGETDVSVYESALSKAAS
jgi:thiol-disulfide isomerase/thioredoxin